ncbi:MAG: hypothetical protein HYW69_00090 [Candidatus Nealsonbacteria bacterium]|nr:hypothetical protein [Candidatus Nealsonbacteria bacterium]
MDLVSERTKILHKGVWKERQVKTIFRKRRDPRVTKEMARAAQDRFSARKAKNPALFDGNVLCLDLENSEIKSNRLVLIVGGSIKYSVFDIIRQENIEKYGWKNFPIGTGGCVAALSSDGKILMHRTYARVDFPNKLSVIGGVYDKGKPFNFIRLELEEEVGIKRGEIEEICLLGISNRIEERINHEFNFYARVSLDSIQILERAKTAKDQEGEIFFLNCSPKTLKKFIIENRQKVPSTHFAGLVLLGRHLWGQNWSKITG